MTLTQLSVRLGKPIPSAYRNFVSRVGAQNLEGTAASPAAICAVNLDARAKVPASTAESPFFVFETDAGDLLFIHEIAEDAAMVKELSSETGRIADYVAAPATLLAELAHTPLPELHKDAGVFVISKTDAWVLSSLDPIDLTELYAAASNLEGVKVFEHQEYQNPFTGEITKSTIPCVDIELEDGAHLNLSLERGRLVCHAAWPKGPTRLIKLAELLGAKVSP